MYLDFVQKYWGRSFFAVHKNEASCLWFEQTTLHRPDVHAWRCYTTLLFCSSSSRAVDENNNTGIKARTALNFPQEQQRKSRTDRWWFHLWLSAALCASPPGFPVIRHTSCFSKSVCSEEKRVGVCDGAADLFEFLQLWRVSGSGVCSGAAAGPRPERTTDTLQRSWTQNPQNQTEPDRTLRNTQNPQN